MQYLEHVLEVVDENQFKLNKKKCNLGQHNLEYLGRVISEEGFTIDLRR